MNSIEEATLDTQFDDPVFIYEQNILPPELMMELRKWLDNQEFKDGYCLDGKQIPRQQLWFQKDMKYFCEEWKCRYDRWVSEEYKNFLLQIQNLIQGVLYSILDEEEPNIYKPIINSCLINKYRDGQDSIKPHSDCPQSFGTYPTIINFSIGGTRDMILQNKKTKEITKITLENNSLLIMAGGSQKYYTHEIPKSNNDDIRYSMTFREYIIKE